MLLLLPSITPRIRIHVRRKVFSCAHTGVTASYDTECAAVSASALVALGASAPLALSITGPRALGATGPIALGTIGPLAMGATRRTATNVAGGNAVTNVGCYRDVSVSSGYDRKPFARDNAGNSTFRTVSEVSVDQSAARGARLRAFAPVAPEESSGKSANCSKSRRSSQLEKLRPSRAASVRAKASRSARNDTLVWVLPRARTPWRLFVLGVLTSHHPRKSSTPQYKNASK